MPNFDLAKLESEYKTRKLSVILKRMLKRHPEYEEHTIVRYEVRDSGDTRVQVCTSRDEVRQVFLSPHCRDAHTLRRGAAEENGDED